MKVTYDQENDLMYIKFYDAEYEVSKEIESGIVLDLDKKGKIIAIEIIDASKKISPNSLREMDYKLLGTEKANQ